MVKNIINISEREDRIVNLIKAKFGLKNKNQAIGLIIQTYAQNFLEPSLRQMEKPQRKRAIQASNLEEVKKVIKE
jgi:uncharacterized protein Veg